MKVAPQSPGYYWCRVNSNFPWKIIKVGYTHDLQYLIVETERGSFGIDYFKDYQWSEKINPPKDKIN